MRSPFVRAVLLALLLVPAWPAATGQPGPLAQVERGRWQLRGPGGSPIASLCLGDPLLLAQPLRGPSPCTSEILASDARSVTVSYVCPGMGRGRSVLRVETPRLVGIDNQGLHHGAPFALRAIARRTGPC
jgi:hypothetical protein